DERWGGRVGAPSPATMIEARHGSGGTRRAMGGPCRGPITGDDDRGASPAPPGRDERWGGPCRGPTTGDDDRGASRLRRGAASDGGGRVGAPSPPTMIEAHPGSAGAQRAKGGMGALSGPPSLDEAQAPGLRDDP